MKGYYPDITFYTLVADCYRCSECIISKQFSHAFFSFLLITLVIQVDSFSGAQYSATKRHLLSIINWALLFLQVHFFEKRKWKKRTIQFTLFARGLGRVTGDAREGYTRHDLTATPRVYSSHVYEKFTSSVYCLFPQDFSTYILKYQSVRDACSFFGKKEKSFPYWSMIT